MRTKTCIDCRKRKSVDAFYRIFKDSEHRQSRCKPCDNRRRAGKAAGYSDVRVDAVRQPDGSVALVRTPRRRAS